MEKVIVVIRGGNVEEIICGSLNVSVHVVDIDNIIAGDKAENALEPAIVELVKDVDARLRKIVKDLSE